MLCGCLEDLRLFRRTFGLSLSSCGSSMQSHLSDLFRVVIIWWILTDCKWVHRHTSKKLSWEFTTQWCSRRWVQCWGRWSWYRCRFPVAPGHSTRSPGSLGIQPGDRERRWCRSWRWCFHRTELLEREKTKYCYRFAFALNFAFGLFLHKRKYSIHMAGSHVFIITWPATHFGKPENKLTTGEKYCEPI